MVAYKVVSCVVEYNCFADSNANDIQGCGKKPQSQCAKMARSEGTLACQSRSSSARSKNVKSKGMPVTFSCKNDLRSFKTTFLAQRAQRALSIALCTSRTCETQREVIQSSGRCRVGIGRVLANKTALRSQRTAQPDGGSRLHCQSLVASIDHRSPVTGSPFNQLSSQPARLQSKLYHSVDCEVLT